MTKYDQKFAATLEPVIGTYTLTPQESSQSSSLEDRARLRITGRDLARQQNIERIVGLAAVESPDSLNDSPATRDWLNQFFDYAQDVADVNTQQVWARLLAIYVANPDTVFKRTLIALHQMDVWEVKAFIEYCSFAFVLDSGWRFVFEEAITRREMWGYVQGQDYTQHFINIGLISPELINMRPKATRGMKISYFAKEYDLVLPDETGAKVEGSEISFGYRKFTATGQQLAKAVNARIYYGYARNLIRTLEAQRNVQFKLRETEEEAFLRQLIPSLVPAI